MKANFKIDTKEAVFAGGTIGGQWGWTLEETEELGKPPVEGPGINPPPGVEPPVQLPVEPTDPTKPPQKPTKPTPEEPVTTPVEPEDGASIQPVGITAVDANGEPVVWQSQDSFSSIDVEPETTYQVSAVRLDVDGKPLGGIVRAIFTTEEEPEDVVIQVAGSISVEVVA